MIEEKLETQGLVAPFLFSLVVEGLARLMKRLTGYDF